MNINNIASAKIISLEKGHAQNENDCLFLHWTCKDGITVSHLKEWLTMKKGIVYNALALSGLLNQEIF